MKSQTHPVRSVITADLDLIQQFKLNTCTPKNLKYNALSDVFFDFSHRVFKTYTQQSTINYYLQKYFHQ